MSLVRVHNFSVSLDGFGKGEGQSVEAPFHHAGHRLRQWISAARRVVDPGGRILAGRASEVRRIEHALKGARSGSLCALGVRGEPGIGKSRLLEELCKRAEAAGFDVLVGRGVESERNVPFGIFVDALDKSFGSLAPEASAGMGCERFDELAAVFPSWAGRGGQAANRLEMERSEFHRAVRAAFDQIAARKPVVLALDDVHWADPASAELIRHLLRSLVPRMVVALSFRPRQAAGLLLDAVAQAAQENLLEELELAPLTIAEAAEALGERPDSPIVQALYSESAGNPFYLEQLARHHSARPAIGDFVVERQGSTATIPTNLRRMISQEVSSLAPDTLRVLQAGAVAGDPFEVELVTAIAAAEKTQVLESLFELEEIDLVRPGTTPGQFCFRHPVVCRVVYEESMPGWRFSAHKKAAAALAEHGAPLAVRAHHIERSATPGDEEAAMTLVQAAATAAPRAPAAAAGWLETALRLLPATGETERRVLLLPMLASALASTGRLRECRTMLEQALELLPAESVSDRVGIIIMIARADHGLGCADETRQLILTALEQAPVGGADAVRLRLELAENQWMCGEWDQVPMTLEPVVSQAQALADTSLLVAARASLAVSTVEQGNIVDALKLVEWVAGALDDADVTQTPELLAALASLTMAEVYLGHFATALRHIERGIKASRATGQAHAFGRFVLGAATVKIILGQLREARQDAEAALEAALLLDNDQLRVAAESVRCWVETLSGDLHTALAAGRAAVQTARRAPRAQYVWLAHACYGQALIACGEFELGRQELLAVGGPELAGMSPGARPLWLQTLVAAEVAVGRIESAEAIVRNMKDVAQGLPHREGSFLHARACVEASRGEYRAAAVSAHRARECCDIVETRVASARARLDIGRALARAGDPARAIEELEFGHAVLRDAGSARLADEAAKELRTLGKRIWVGPATDSSDQDGLTRREREVAERVAQGYTNREIAADLFLSPKTVEKHLARVFTKLEVSSRGGVAAAMTQRPGTIKPDVCPVPIR
ncbi:helix-turn-helix transcriptional regulator [Nocardia abscessus]|uniref:helix-turn-helix transcriptional regulator n=1 Tax=Nocardia abscessus TaxID=120957 RepID=UPI002456744F|nr:LuxR family transcriptional regulator [Nocardia abscessus]